MLASDIGDRSDVQMIGKMNAARKPMAQIKLEYYCSGCHSHFQIGKLKAHLNRYHKHQPVRLHIRAKDSYEESNPLIRENFDRIFHH
jgi:hypothetical protein